jgi:hypothetical protein
LQFIYDDAGSEPGIPVGALTTENRDVWTRAREELLAFSERNRVCFTIAVDAIILFQFLYLKHISNLM